MQVQFGKHYLLYRNSQPLTDRERIETVAGQRGLYLHDSVDELFNRSVMSGAGAVLVQRNVSGQVDNVMLVSEEDFKSYRQDLQQFLSRHDGLKEGFEYDEDNYGCFTMGNHCQPTPAYNRLKQQFDNEYVKTFASKAERLDVKG